MRGVRTHRYSRTWNIPGADTIRRTNVEREKSVSGGNNPNFFCLPGEPLWNWNRKLSYPEQAVPESQKAI